MSTQQVPFSPYDMEIVRGVTYSDDFSALDGTGNPIDLTNGYTAELKLARRFGGTDEDVILTADLSSEYLSLDPNDGSRLELTIDAETSALWDWRVCRYQLIVKDSTDAIVFAFRGYIRLWRG